MGGFAANFGRAPSNIERVKLKAWFRKHFPVTLIWGLVLSYSIVEYSTVCILMLYLTNWRGRGLFQSAILINLLEVLSSVFVFFLAYIGDHFNFVVFSTGCYIMGLILLWISAWSSQGFSMFYLTLLLIALGKSGGSFPLKSFLGSQIRDRNRREEGEQKQRDVAGTQSWWYSARIFGYAMAVFTYGHDSWLQNFNISALIMGATSQVFFYLGFFAYDYAKPEKMSLRNFMVLFQDKPKSLLLLWASFIPYSMVLVTGNTLFLSQIKNFDNHIGNNNFRFRVPSFLFVIKSLTSDLVVFLFWCWGHRYSSRTTHSAGTVTKVRIGAGMVCAVFCCVAARQVEIFGQTSSPSVLMLTPQYCLLGLMEGLAGGGLFTSILIHFPVGSSSRRKFAETFTELVLCVGKFFSMPFLLIFKFWFEQNINTGLGRYFEILAIVSSLFFCLYLYWALSNYGHLGSNLETTETVENVQAAQQEEQYDQEAEDNQIQTLETVVEFVNHE